MAKSQPSGKPPVIITAGQGAVSDDPVPVTIPDWWSQSPGSAASGAGVGLPTADPFGQIQPTDYLPICYGLCRVGGKVLLNQEVYYAIEQRILIVFCEGGIDSIVNVLYGGGPFVTTTGSPYSHTVTKYTGALSDPTPHSMGFNTSDLDTAGWSPNPACATVWAYGQASGAVYPWWWGFPGIADGSDIAFGADVKGRKVYDPRTGLVAYSNNPALIFRDLLVTYGLMSATQIDDTSITAAANVCDASGFACNLVISAQDSLENIIKSVLLTCNGVRTTSNGKLGLWVDGLNTSDPVATLSELNGDIFDVSYTWLPAQQRPTRVVVNFLNADSQYQPDSVKVEDPGVAGGTVTLCEMDFQIPGCTTTAQAKILADYLYNSSAISFRMKGSLSWKGLALSIGQKVRVITLAGIDAPFLIEQLDEDQVGTSPIVLRPYLEAVYDTVPISQPPPILPPGTGATDTPSDVTLVGGSPTAYTGTFTSPTVLPAAGLPQTTQTTVSRTVTTKDEVTLDFTVGWPYDGWELVVRWATGLVVQADFDGATWDSMSANEAVIPQGGNLASKSSSHLSLVLSALIGETDVTTTYPSGATASTSVTGGGWKVIVKLRSAVGNDSSGVAVFAAPYSSSSTPGDTGGGSSYVGNDLTLIEETAPSGVSGKTVVYMDSADHVAKFKENNGAAQEIGTLRSVGLAVPSDDYDISGSPLTADGSITVSKKSKSANVVLAGPGSGADAAPTFRSLVQADLPVMTGDSGSGGVKGAVPAPAASDASKYLRGDASWHTPFGGSTEVPSGSIDGTNTSFTCVNALGAHDLVIVDGIVDTSALAGSGTTIITSIAPRASLVVVHLPGGDLYTVPTTAEPANTVFAGPVSGGPASPTFRALTSADVAGLTGGGGNTLVTQFESDFSPIGNSFGVTGAITPITGSDGVAYEYFHYDTRDTVAQVGGVLTVTSTYSGVGHGFWVGIKPSSFSSWISATVHRRHLWAVWLHVSSYTFASDAYGGANLCLGVGLPPIGRLIGIYGGSLNLTTMRYMNAVGIMRNYGGTPNNSSGGLAFYRNSGGNNYVEVGYGSAGYDTFALKPDSLGTFGVYAGNWSSGWPSWDSMTLVGYIQHITTGALQSLDASSYVAIAPSISQLEVFAGFEYGSSGESASFDRWRVTTWE